MPYIYKIINDVNQKLYIGKTLNTIEERWKEHLNDYKKPRCEKRPLYDAMQKYGAENFHVELVEECNHQVLNERECYWIEFYGAFKHGYNATRGGDGRAYADYDLIYKTYQESGTIKKTSELTGYDRDTVQKAVKCKGGFITPTSQHLQKPIAMIDKNTGEVLRTFSHSRAAEQYLGISYNSHISDVCLGKRKTSNGYKWKYLISTED